MKTNTYKTIQEKPIEEKKISENKWVKRVPKWKFLSNDFEDDNSQYIQKVIFITLLGILYISNSFQAEKSEIRINKLEKSVEKLRVEYSTLKYDFINESKRSQIEERVAPLGLVPPETAPIVITVPNLEDN
ncbi:FtsL-like putative cell division protein [Flammeovirga kamogawensis]|uniref:S-adenosyl-methyltransferase n=1 Tax=Flammeovirga kamogawensis TaxID=373891 RepID=A0ABX8GUU0_9BACT|nr:FtsL-like putative cell division protein [Flammeovirga kamogawensis]MBB6459600.1 hypothetical protein [Flammeovirga kamogawensis]QWG07336.1 hypothetical protein KM029_18835 [Flammeovirga kamogawensis]TRX69153.1 hypothetical protein EO216_13835 [Flammeovirga kamogawensis]